MDPLRELPYGPAACDSRSKRPDTCQHPTTLRALRKILLAPTGASTHVHDDNIAFPQFWNENLIDIGLERSPVDRPIENHRRDHARQAQAGDEGRRLPVAVRDGGTQPLAAGRPPASTRHIGRRPCLVDEDELVRIEVDLAVEPFLPPLHDVRPLLLGGVRGLFLSVIFRRWKKRDNAETLKAYPSAASAAFISSNVLSGLTAISARMRSAGASIAALRLRRHLARLALAPPSGSRSTRPRESAPQPLDATCRPQRQRPHACEDRPKEMSPCPPASFASRQLESEPA